MSSLKRKLLIVDDEPGTRLLLSQIFTGLGHDVSCAADGIAALQRMREWVPEIILSDLNMPGMSGFELLSVVRRRLPEIYVIATSGAFSGSNVPDGIPADAFYEKATGLAALFKLMETAGEKAEATRPSPSRSPVPPVPIWVAVDRSSPNDEGLVAVSCPECLRIFTYALVSGADVVHRESCIHCFSHVLFAIVEVLGPVSESSYQNLLGAEMATRDEAGADG